MRVTQNYPTNFHGAVGWTSQCLCSGYLRDIQRTVQETHLKESQEEQRPTSYPLDILEVSCT